jgi:hypothetical protein
VLVHQVTKTYIDAAGSMPVIPLTAGEYTPRSGGGMSDGSIWDQVLSSPLDGGRCVIVRHAEKLKSLAYLPVLLSAEGMDTTLTVFISADEDFPRSEVEGKKGLVPPLADVQASRHGQLIRCCAPGKEEDLVDLVASWWPPAGANFAHRLLTVCEGSLYLAWSACDKGVRAGLEPTDENASRVCQLVPARDFAELLVAGEKARALECARLVRQNDIGPALGLLASRLSALSAIGAGKQRGWDGQELVVKLKLDRFLLRKLGPLAGSYPPERVRRCREVLAVAESAWRAGAYEGIPESVAALW